eukprot:gene18358-20204_t
MASVIEADTALWLRNKLENDDQWSSGGLTLLLTSEVLRNTYHCFRSLDHRVRLKLLLAFIEMRRRNLENLKDELNMVISLGLDDEDDWVRMIAFVLKDYPYSSDLCTDMRSENETLSQIIKELSIQVNESASQLNELPCECSYLNKTALSNSYGIKPPPFKNFTLRRKPKSAALRAQLTQRGTSKESNKQPNIHAKLNITGPVRHHTRPTLRGTALPKKTKLLDITEQPIGGSSREAKKRRKQHELELAAEDAKVKKTSELQRHTKQSKLAGESQKANMEADHQNKAKNQTEEGDASKKSARDTAKEEVKPSYAVIPGTGKASSYAPSATNTLAVDSNPLVTVDPNASLATQEVQRELQVRIRQEQVLRLQQQQILKDFRTPPQQPRIASDNANLPSVPPPLSSLQPAVRDMKEQPKPIADQTARVNQQAKRGLSLTREQMLAAQEMFRSANKVTRAEKALILGFMAGARDNPFPQQGPVLTIKLSEDEEKNSQTEASGQSTLIEMLFEMNYETGHWRRLKRTRVLAPVQLGGEST